MSQLRRRLVIAQPGRLPSLLLLIALVFKAFGPAAAAELFEGGNAPLQIPAKSAIAELPAPAEVPTDIAAELKRLQKQKLYDLRVIPRSYLFYFQYEVFC